MGSLKFEVLLFVFILTPSHFPNSESNTSPSSLRLRATPHTHHSQLGASLPVSRKPGEEQTTDYLRFHALSQDACMSFPPSLRFKYPTVSGQFLHFSPFYPTVSELLQVFISFLSFLFISPASISTVNRHKLISTAPCLKRRSNKSLDHVFLLMLPSNMSYWFLTQISLKTRSVSIAFLLLFLIYLYY